MRPSGLVAEGQNAVLDLGALGDAGRWRLGVRGILHGDVLNAPGLEDPTTMLIDDGAGRHDDLLVHVAHIGRDGLPDRELTDLHRPHQEPAPTVRRNAWIP